MIEYNKELEQKIIKYFENILLFGSKHSVLKEEEKKFIFSEENYQIIYEILKNIRYKKTQLSNFEKFVTVVYLKNNLILRGRRSNFISKMIYLFGSRFKDINAFLSNTSSENISSIMSSLSDELAAEESLTLGHEYTQEDMNRAFLESEYFKWWKNSMNIVQEQKRDCQIEGIEVQDKLINDLESELMNLNKSFYESNRFLAVLVTSDEDVYVNTQKFGLYYDNGRVNLRGNGNLLLEVEFKCDFHFYIHNSGNIIFYVDSHEILPGYYTYLDNNSVIDIRPIDFSFVFEVNVFFVDVLKKQMSN